jgi:ribosomal protein S18 acetylase RimI-like enzyme
MRLHTIGGLDDPWYDRWLDIYQRSFPLDQQLLVSAHNRMLRAGDRAERGPHYVVALEDLADGPICVGMAQYALFPDVRGAALWYLAVDPGHRNRGIGGWMYDAIVDSIHARMPQCRGTLIEVELPDRCADPALALRRIGFYTRKGAVLLEGLHSTVDVGWQPPLTMGIMVHPLESLGADEIRLLAEDILASAAQP